VFGEITTGASDDIERCTDIARGMVTQYGMSDKLGPQQLGKVKGEVFLGYDKGHEADYSAEVGRRRRRRGAPPDRLRPRPCSGDPVTHRDTARRAGQGAGREGDPRGLDLAEIFGPLDKGTGIAVPGAERIEVPVPAEPELVGRGGGRGPAGREPSGSVGRRAGAGQAPVVEAGGRAATRGPAAP
jgi:hypothetical protein